MPSLDFDTAKAARPAPQFDPEFLDRSFKLVTVADDGKSREIQELAVAPEIERAAELREREARENRLDRRMEKVDKTAAAILTDREYAAYRLIATMLTWCAAAVAKSHSTASNATIPEESSSRTGSMLRCAAAASSPRRRLPRSPGRSSSMMAGWPSRIIPQKTTLSGTLSSATPTSAPRCPSAWE